MVLLGTRQFFIFTLVVAFGAYTSPCKGQSKFDKEIASLVLPKKEQSEKILGVAQLADRIVLIKEAQKDILSISRTSIIIETFDEGLRQLNRNQIDPWTEDKSHLLKSLVSTNDELQLLSTYFDEVAGQYILQAEQIDTDSLVRDGGVVKMVVNSAKRKGDVANFRILQFPEAQRILVYHEIKLPQMNYQLAISVFDYQMKCLWHDTLNFGCEKELVELNLWAISKSDEAILATKQFRNSRNHSRGGKSNFDIHLYRVGTAKQHKQVLPNNDQYISAFQFYITEDKISSISFFSENNWNSAAGFLRQNWLESNGELEQLERASFGRDIIAKNQPERQVKRLTKKIEAGESPELNDFKIDHFYERPEGGSLLFAEQFYEKIEYRDVSTMSAFTDGSSNKSIYYNDILIIALSENGEVEWQDKIAKRQLTFNDNGFFSSYVLHRSDYKTFLFYNNSPENLFYGGVGRVAQFSKGRDGVVTMAEIDSDGRVFPRTIYSHDDRGLVLVPRWCLSLTNGNVLLGGNAGLNKKFVIIKPQ